MAEIKKILCAVDFGPVTAQVLDYAKTISTCLDAEIYIIYVVHSLDFIEQFSVPQSYREEYEKQMIDQAKEKIKEMKASIFKDNKAEFILKAGDPAKEILLFAEKENVDLIVIGAINKKSLGGFLFGSVGEKVIKASNAPVLVIKP
jgi:nucleotide-binding universal stress UspA family protein